MVYLIISLLASVAGAICGIGGGVIIKPVLDLFQLGSASSISFLSSCTVLSMSLYSVGKSVLSGEKTVNAKVGTPLAIGAALGGLVGKYLFTCIEGLFPSSEGVRAVQASCLALVTLFTLVYTLLRHKTHSYHISSPFCCICIGLVLGLISSFLGIGGGPINLAVLFFFFSMDTKTAAANSLYIILVSQIASLLLTLFSDRVPEFEWAALLFMILGGICGGIIGRSLCKRIPSRIVNALFIGLMGVIICISIFNICNCL